ncbi:hypothetical protein GCM10007939_22920 [Amylibacter marinus]|uniref:Uncharacterized protein n=1 Tax=Amylibacter marinus TaxID=1475483 RepID=A0ABQ5VX42_9RHOB|nr:hypothetical protein [Amylibacter marinus]GLQ36008.1 hypothetical protein GCM10007939_22920 [Amylibacter marinus]
MKLIDLNHPFFQPVITRISVVIVLICWGIFELTTGRAMWAVIFIGVGVICAWRFATIDYADLDED